MTRLGHCGVLSSLRPPGAVLAAVLALVLLAAGCSGDSDRSAPAASRSTASVLPAAPAIRTVVTWGKVTGRLPHDDRTRVARQVADVVDRWVKVAYVGGHYPRRGFTHSWPGFTPGAKKLARRDRSLTTNQDIGRRIDGVRPERSHVRLDALAVHRHAVGLTARVYLRFRTTGRVHRDVRVKGSLYLTRTDHGWKVFGYDLTKGAV